MSRVEDNLTQRLSNILEDLTFNQWCEATIDEISPIKIPINLAYYFPLRRIKEIRVNNRLSFPARIFADEDNFTIEIKYSSTCKNYPWYRVLLAHEIGHTFEYEIKNDSLIQRAFFLPGSVDAEYFSERLGRTILAPRKVLYSLFGKNVKTTDISLKKIDLISKKLNIPSRLLLTRILNDISIFSNVIILRFYRNNAKGLWKLIETHRSNEYNNRKYYVPIRRSINNTIEEKSISCGETLSKYLDSININIEYDEEIQQTIYGKEMVDKPIRTLMKNFINYDFENSAISRYKIPSGDLLNILLRINK